MEIIRFLESRNGIALLHFTQTLLFGMMVYIIGAEYLRTKRDDLIYKLVASFSITFINFATTVIVVLDIFYNITVSQKFVPLVFNSLFAIIVLALSRAFVYEYVGNKEKFENFIKGAMMSVVVVYGGMQIIWYFTFKPGMVFGTSPMQLLFSVFFVLVLLFSIYHIIKFRKTYRGRLVIAFLSIVVVQLITIYGTISDVTPPYILLIKSASPILVPMMFTSVVFKELIESVVIMVKQLQHSLEHQRDLIFELTKVGSDLSTLSDDLVKMSIDGWQKLSFVVQTIQAQERDNDNMMELTNQAKEGIDFMTKTLARRSDNSNVIILSDEKLEEEMDEEQKRMLAIVKDISLVVENTHVIISDTNKVLQKLLHSSDEITNSINEIEDISDKTAMLSINASIEAARAMEYGKGFSIVAHEITKLADKSQKHSGIITTIIRDIVTGVKNINKNIGGVSIEVERTIKELKGIYSFITDAVRMTHMFESIVAKNNDVYNKIEEYGSRIKKEMDRTGEIVSSNKIHGQEMKTAIGNHISEIESIAELSDKLKELVKSMNVKTNESIAMAEQLQNFVE